MSIKRSARLTQPTPGFAGPETSPKYAPVPELEPVHLELDLRLDLPNKSVHGEQTLTLHARRSGARKLSLDAVHFQSLRVDDQPGLSWRYDGQKLHLEWAEGLKSGQRITAHLRWEVVDPIAGLRFGSADEGTFVASDHETSRARYWIPAVDHPLVRTTAEIRLHHDPAHTAVSAGALVGTKPGQDGLAVTTWRLDERTPIYLLCVVVGDLVCAEDGAFEGAPIAYYAPRPHSAENLLRSFGRSAEMLQYLTTKLDRPLPWPKYFQFAVAGIGGAMENVSLVSWDDAWVMDETYHAEMGWLVDSVNLHEMAHTWFGDRVVCREFAHVWLKESWATYMEGVFVEDTIGSEAFHGHMHEDAIAYQGEVASRYARPIVTRHFESGWDMFDHHLYPGGAWRLHMLRQQLGDEVFWDGVRSYLARFDEQVADTADFRKELEAASGRNLNAFFDQWFHRPGYPQLKAEWSQDDGQGTLRVTQTQIDKDKGIGAFTFPLVVAVEHSAGQWTRHTLQCEHAVTSLTVPLTGPVVSIVLDPDTQLLHKLDFDPGRDRLIRALSGDSVRGRIHAAQALCDSGDPTGIHAIVAAWTKEPAFRVRRAWARYLGSAKSHAAPAALAQILELETDPKVMTTLCAACENHRAPELSAALQDWLAVPGRPYRASGHALTALGKQRADAPIDLLIEKSKDSGWWGWVQRGAMLGLGESGHISALERLHEVTLDPSIRRPVRIAATTALGVCARVQDRAQRERTLAQLAVLARHPDYGTRMAAAQAIKALGEPAGASEIDGIVERVAVQDKPRVRKLAAALRKSDPGSDRKTIESLEERLRKLEARLATLEGK